MATPIFFFVDSNSPSKDLLFQHDPNQAHTPLYLEDTVLKRAMLSFYMHLMYSVQNLRELHYEVTVSSIFYVRKISVLARIASRWERFRQPKKFEKKRKHPGEYLEFQVMGMIKWRQK